MLHLKFLTASVPCVLSFYNSVTRSQLQSLVHLFLHRQESSSEEESSEEESEDEDDKKKAKPADKKDDEKVV